MKKLRSLFGVFLFSLFILLPTLAIAQDYNPEDTVLNVANVTNQVNEVIAYQAGHNLTWKILFFAMLSGILIRIIITTIEGVKSRVNKSPMQFAFSYWVKDNILSKIASVMTIILSTSIIEKLPVGVVAYIVFGLIGLLAGYFLDWVYNSLRKLISR